MSRADQELAADALDRIAVLKRHLARGDLTDETIADAVSLRLAPAIEVISKTSVEFREGNFGEDWKIIWATRNRLVHGYAYIDIEVIRDTITQDLPGLERKLRDSINEGRRPD